MKKECMKNNVLGFLVYSSMSLVKFIMSDIYFPLAILLQQSIHFILSRFFMIFYIYYVYTTYGVWYANAWHRDCRDQGAGRDTQEDQRPISDLRMRSTHGHDQTWMRYMTREDRRYADIPRLCPERTREDETDVRWWISNTRNVLFLFFRSSIYTYEKISFMIARSM